MYFGTRRRWMIVVSVTLFAAAVCTAASRAAENAVPPKDLPAACRAAKANFRPISQSDVDQAKTELLEALGRLDQRLSQAGPNGDDWRKYILWDKLQDELRRDKPDRAALHDVEDRYRPDHDGLELVWFIDVQHALHEYAAMLGAVDNPAIRTAYEQRLDRLAKTLEAYVAKPATEDAVVISESVHWLESTHQCPALVEAIQDDLVHPNVFAALSPELVGAGIAECVDDTTQVDDCILGTSMHGIAHTIGQSCTELAPNPDCGVVDTLFSGVTYANNVGYHGRITICSTATACLSARKRLCMTAEGLSAQPAVSCAQVSAEICDIQSCKGRRMVERMAWKKACKMKPEAECISSRHAEQRLNERIDARAAESLEKANQKYNDKFYRPFTERKLFPQMLRFSTTEQAFLVTGLQAGRGKVAAPGEPPPVTAAGADMTLRLHESMVNNLSFDALAGRTIYEEKVQATAVDLLGRLPDKMKGEPGKRWAITFAPRQPISVTFTDDGFRVTIRGIRYYRWEEWEGTQRNTVPNLPMNVSASYKIEKSPEGQFRAVRQGGIEAFPPGFVPGSSQKLSAVQTELHNKLEKRFETIFEPEFLGKGLDLPGKWKAFGKLMPVEIVCRDGWLLIAWKRAAAPPKVAVE